VLKELIMRSEVIKEWLESKDYNCEHAVYYINRSADLVHYLIDYLSGYYKSDIDIIADIMDELRVDQKENDEIVNKIIREIEENIDKYRKDEGFQTIYTFEKSIGYNILRHVVNHIVTNIEKTEKYSFVKDTHYKLTCYGNVEKLSNYVEKFKKVETARIYTGPYVSHYEPIKVQYGDTTLIPHEIPKDVIEKLVHSLPESKIFSNCKIFTMPEGYKILYSY
ncbi:MAG: hypothetical protein Edafosvirus55_1, partial [Edafosvirus sp.]